MYAIRSYYVSNEIAAEAYIGVGGVKTGLYNTRESFVEAQEAINVITSYSIHYTKLYDVLISNGEVLLRPEMFRPCTHIILEIIRNNFV